MVNATRAYLDDQRDCQFVISDASYGRFRESALRDGFGHPARPRGRRRELNGVRSFDRDRDSLPDSFRM